MIEKKYFSRYRKSVQDLPNLVETQLDSFNWLTDKGLKEVFEEFSPIEDYAGKEFVLEFGDFFIEPPKYSEQYTKENNLIYEGALKVKVKLTNKTLDSVKEQEVFLADFPLMTERGTFIVNGAERVVVSQLARSSGAYFTDNIVKGRKRFGAKVIPNRGAWVEIETDFDGTMFVRIDRGRKMPASLLLKIFGFDTNEKIKEAFRKIDNGETSFINKTLEKDATETPNEAYVEIYNKIRPGEPINVEGAKKYLNDMFGSARYDLSEVGRYRLNHRLGLSLDDMENAPRTLSSDDLKMIVTEVINLNNTPDAKSDDIDHLGSRRVRGVGELLQNRIRVGMTQMKKNIQDRMSTLDPDTLVPTNLINSRPLMARIKEFFATNQLSQFMQQINVLDELEHLRRLSAMGTGGLTKERAGFDVRDVHSSHYGRICPIETPEGPSIGLVVHLAVHARLNKYGIIETPYRKVDKSIISNEISYLNALDEAKYNIAHASISYDVDNGKIKTDEVEARVKTNPKLAPKDSIDYIDLSSNQAFSVAASLIPFLEHDDATRTLMGSNMQRQSVPCICPQTPYVGTGIEEKVVRDSGRSIVARQDGTISSVDSKHITIQYKDLEEEKYDLVTFARSNHFTTVHQRPIVNVGDKVKKGDILTDHFSSEEGHLALGQNVKVAFLSWSGYNFEDAIVLSENLVKRDIFSSIHIKKFEVNIRDTKLGPEVNTYDIPNVSEEKLKNLDEEGIVRIGAEVGPGDILVGKISPKGEADLTSEERLLRAIFGEKVRDVKDSSLRMEHGKRGRVVGVKIFARDKGDKLEPGIIKKIVVDVAQLRKISVGDKLAGRHGNKGVISRILPEEDMPHLEDGTPVDVVLNPLGVASRMNIGQILETHLGWAAEKLGYQAISPILSGATEEEIKEELKKAGLPEDGKVTLYDGRTGEAFNNKVTVGNMYMLKLNHMVQDKLHMRAIGPYSLITQQPLGGKAQGGGQRLGEMEVWALEGYGAAHTLQEMLTVKSDDIVGRAAVYDSIIRKEPFKAPNLPASFHVLMNELKGLALDVEVRQTEKEETVEERGGGESES